MVTYNTDKHKMEAGKLIALTDYEVNLEKAEYIHYVKKGEIVATFDQNTINDPDITVNFENSYIDPRVKLEITENSIISNGVVVLSEDKEISLKVISGKWSLYNSCIVIDTEKTDPEKTYNLGISLRLIDSYVKSSFTGLKNDTPISRSNLFMERSLIGRYDGTSISFESEDEGSLDFIADIRNMKTKGGGKITLNATRIEIDGLFLTTGLGYETKIKAREIDIRGVSINQDTNYSVLSADNKVVMFSSPMEPTDRSVLRLCQNSKNEVVFKNIKIESTRKNCNFILGDIFLDAITPNLNILNYKEGNILGNTISLKNITFSGSGTESPMLEDISIKCRTSDTRSVDVSNTKIKANANELIISQSSLNNADIFIHNYFYGGSVWTKGVAQINNCSIDLRNFKFSYQGDSIETGIMIGSDSNYGDVSIIDCKLSENKPMTILSQEGFGSLLLKKSNLQDNIFLNINSAEKTIIEESKIRGDVSLSHVEKIIKSEITDSELVKVDEIINTNVENSRLEKFFGINEERISGVTIKNREKEYYDRFGISKYDTKTINRFQKDKTINEDIDF